MALDSIGMKKQTKLWAVYFVLVLSGGGTPLVHGAEVWKSDFKDGLLGGWGAYGNGCQIKVAEEQTLKQNVLEATFDDSSIETWANKGARIKIEGGIEWDKFKYLLFRYKVSPAVGTIGCLLHDTNGNWWGSLLKEDPSSMNGEALKANEWDSIALKKTTFAFKWNDDASITSGEMNAEIVEMYIFAGLSHVNESEQYTFKIAEVAFSLTLPEGQAETVIPSYSGK